ncbi:hypothetical protein U1Q18_046250 [Sarracenia purpurea var. burkii]
MAFRGRGRGRGYGGYGRGGGFGAAKQEPFVLFPEIENFPDAKEVNEEIALVIWSTRLQKFWSSSAYYLKSEGPNKDENTDIERFSDRGNRRTEQKNKLSDFMKCSAEYVPAELAQDSVPERYGRRKVRWNQESDLQKLDLFEKLEQKYQGQDEKGGKEKKDDENEEEDDEKIEEEEEFSDDGDYNQNIDFDDDEDDFNMDDGNDDEGIY